MRPPLPPFTAGSARQKVQAAEDGWNSRDPKKVALAYTEDTIWHNRDQFINGRVFIFPCSFSRTNCKDPLDSLLSLIQALGKAAPRLIIPPDSDGTLPGLSCYHITSRVVQRQFLFKDEEPSRAS